MPETWSHCNGERAAPDTAPTPLSRYPQTLGSCCGCWWHQENKAPSSCPSRRHFEFRAPNSLHTLPFKTASQSPSLPEISSQLQKPGTHWEISSPSLRLPELSPWIAASLPTHPGTASPFSHSSLELQLQNPVRTTLACCGSPGPPLAGQASLLAARVPSPFPASG